MEATGQPVVNAADHGLSPDGTGSMNYRALQAALGAANDVGGVVWIEAGVYAVDQPH